jgi:uncharacterized protein (DUF1684 family)
MLARSRYRIVMIFAIIATFNATYVLAVDAAQAQRDVEQWRAARVGRLTSPTGWLTLVGLYWFNEGANSFGRAEKNTLVLDHKTMPNTLGTFTLSKGKVIFTADPGSTVTQAGKPVKSIAMRPDTSDEPTVLDAGPIEFFVIERVGKMGLRVRDTEHPARKNFHGIDYFPINSAWAVDAKFEPYTPVHYIEIINILGMTEKMESPGAVVFKKDGKEYRLDAILEAPDEKELFIMFADATSARETYGAGRFIYIPLPINGRAVVDFNKAYNPPCAFNDFATCPLPPPQNRLQLRVDAGEKKYVTDRH